MKRIRPFIGTDLVKVMTGIRRCGKSVMLDLIKEELKELGISAAQFITFNFEDLRNANFCTASSLHDEVIRRASEISGKVYLFFDEIQEVTDWEKCINSLRIEMDCDIYITGSNARLLSGELATVLGGRYVEFTIYPFSYAEFMDLYKDIFPDASDSAVFQKYLTLGGMPYLANLRYAEEPSKQYLTDVYNSIILNDVVKRQDIQGKQILSTNEKYYMADHGLREAVFGSNMRDINLVLENIVYMELLRRGYTITVGKSGAKEVDFICQKQDQKVYVQVTYLLASEETIQREFGIYDSIHDNFPKYVVSMDELDFSRNGIKHRNIKEFLLLKEWN